MEILRGSGSINLKEIQIKEIEEGIKGYYVIENGKFDKKALMIGVKHPLYKFVVMFLKMNRINFER